MFPAISLITSNEPEPSTCWCGRRHISGVQRFMLKPSTGCKRLISSVPFEPVLRHATELIPVSVGTQGRHGSLNSADLLTCMARSQLRSVSKKSHPAFLAGNFASPKTATPISR